MGFPRPELRGLWVLAASPGRSRYDSTSLLTTVTGRSCDTRLVSSEVADEGLVNDVARWYPAAYLRTIPLPVSQILCPPPHSPRVKEFFNCDHGPACHKTRRWRWGGWRRQR